MTVVLLFLLLFLLLWLFFYAALPLLDRTLSRAAHWTAAFRYRDYVPVFIVLAIGVVAASAAGDAFEDLAELLHEESPQLREVDTAVHEWARYTRTTGSTRFFTTMTLVGTPVGLGILAGIASIALMAKRRWRWAAYLAFTTCVGGLLNLQLKAFFARQRPELAEALRHASGYSFPSGHAMGAIVVFGALAYLGLRILPKWRWRAAALALCLTLTLAIASSRVYLGVHWISDIAAGLAAGLIWVTTTTVAYETFRRIRLVRALRAKRDA
ncbi:MAG TPA: phosphatase PAP2 family protein [Thermoanaerobaculia bacterium]|nr:phosphatase PAP2 family protein [Thermoanaerobaculia bacterium]